MKRFWCVALLLSTIACGSSSSSPSAPSTATSAPSPANVNGVWNGTVTLASVTGGECFGPSFLALIGTGGQISVAFAQNGSSTTAVWTAVSGGGNFSYTGSVGTSAVTMTDTACSACNQIGLQCPNSTAKRDILLQSGNFNGTTLDGRTMTATDAKIYNLVDSTTRAAVGTVTLSSNVTLTKS